VPGLPQSATGQVTLLTGENASRLVGRHVTAYPTLRLRALLEERGLFTELRRRDIRATLANAYTPEYFTAVAGRRLRHAAITLNALQAGMRLRAVDDVRAGQAVSQDLTNARLREWGHAVPLISPEAAGRHLARIAAAHAFTLFEYFLTDLAGPGLPRSPPMTPRTLRVLEFSAVCERLAGLCASALGREAALALRPSPALEEAARAQRETSEARVLAELGNGLPVSGIRDIRDP